jgi:hypothetical protein
MTTPVKADEKPPAPQPTPLQKAFADAREQLKVAEATEENQPEVAEQDATEATTAAAPPEQAEQEKETEQAEGEEKAEGQEGQEGTEAPSDILVEIPGRHADKPLKLAVEDEETANALRALVKGNVRRDQLHRETENLQRQRDELDMVEQHLTLDPVGFLTDRVKPEIRLEVARHLLSIPEVFAEITKDMTEWDDPDKLKLRQAELRAARADSQRGTEREMARIKEAKEQGRLVRDTVAAIVPTDMEEEDATMFVNDCLTDVMAWANAHPDVRRLRPEEVIGILDRRLRHHGMTPESALAALSSGQPFRRSTAARPGKVPASGTPDAEEARTAGAKLKQAGEARRAAAAVPGAGAGARPTKIEPPAQQSVKERIKWVKEQLLGKS